jgi:spore germination protein GerM
LEYLLQGPAENEKKEFFTSINPGVKVNSLEIEDGIAKVDFSKEIEEDAGGSCRVLSIRAQITETLKQFPTVKNVVISVDGRVDDALQP